MARTATGIDVGARSAVALKGSWKGGTFHVTNVAIAENHAGDLGSGWAGLAPDFKLGRSRIGISGREVNVRYTRVPAVPDWQLRNLMRFEVQEIGDQSGAEVASDFNLLPRPPEIDGEDVVLLAMSRETLLDEHQKGLEAAGGTLDAFSPASIALYNAFVRYGVVQDDTVLVANIGHETTDVVLVRGADLLFARNLSGGSRLFDEALMQRLGMGASQAESVKIDHVDLTPGARPRSAESEKATRAVMGAAGQLTSLLQSAVMFCKTQVKLSGLKVDRVLICGGGAALAGLPEYLSAGMGVPVHLFDAFHVVDTSALTPEESEVLEAHELEAVVALGLATMASDKDAYSLEIVPSGLAKKREFFGGTLWLIAAGLLGIGFLGFRVQHLAAKLDRVEGVSRGLASKVKRARAIHESTEELVAANAELAVRTESLQGIAGSGEQVARALAFFDDHLPQDFWITRIESSFESDQELGIERQQERPVLVVRGSLREGVDSPTEQFQAMVNKLQETMPKAVLNPGLDRQAFSIDMSLFAPVETPANNNEDA
ncbi:Competence protein A [Planctomycetes bacterium Poly30]|uniref:Competence protein A n=1 Tax=Saltatorellus ferox TaxID=2528018 RepID=A0A518EQT7_9BACT|nr:Competence protein A [Planctomycetes bacterium Poly30]